MMWPVAGKKMPGLATRQTTTKGGYRGDNINDVGADYREQGRVCQVDVCLFYFVVIIDCFCIVFL
ncbi:hypothetical protein [Cardiobacterium hominis]|uniref:hypothetical protein n=1 Tax=Cardiobacterium hominis TaxID=2718 RepID=UPI0028EB8761|nr:hypothetical protein [Cardiobacterium hominis]